MSTRARVLTLAVALAAGCSPADREAGRSGTADSAAGRAGTAAETTRVATHLAAWKWDRETGEERFTLVFTDDRGAPARPAGPIASRVMRDLGVLRLRLPASITSTAVTDSVFQGGLVARAFAVRALDDRALFVDVHPRAPIDASMAPHHEPNEWSVLVRRGGTPWPVTAASERRVVVLSPRRGATVDSLLEIAGYARTFESNVVARLEVPGKVGRDTFTTAAEWSETWGEFRLVLPGPRSVATLKVGEHSAEDGSFQGVSIPLRPPRTP